jgi:hypothetical protein
MSFLLLHPKIFRPQISSQSHGSRRSHCIMLLGHYASSQMPVNSTPSKTLDVRPFSKTKDTAKLRLDPINNSQMTTPPRRIASMGG